MRVFLLILLSFQVCSQTPGLDSIAQNYKNQDARFKPYDYHDFAVAPWQSVRLISHNHYQIDIQGSLEELLAVDLALVQRDMSRVWADMHHESFELIDRGYKIRRHTSIGYWPLQRWFHWEYDPRNAFDPFNCPAPCNGWFMQVLSNGLIYGRKQLGPDLYQVSFVRFLKFNNGPKY